MLVLSKMENNHCYKGMVRDGDWCVFIVAPDRKTARKILWSYMGSICDDCEWIDMRLRTVLKVVPEGIRIGAIEDSGMELEKMGLHYYTEGGNMIDNITGKEMICGNCRHYLREKETCRVTGDNLVYGEDSCDEWECK